MGIIGDKVRDGEPLTTEEMAAREAANAEYGTGMDLYRNTVRRAFEAIEGGYIELADAEALIMEALEAAYKAAPCKE